MNDTEALDEIGAILGETEDWEDPVGYLSAISEIIDETGRPHPGIADYAEGAYAARCRAERVWSSRLLPRERDMLTDAYALAVDRPHGPVVRILRAGSVVLNDHDDATLRELIRLAGERS